MANFFPLVANYSANIANGFVGNRIEELRPGDNLDFTLSGIANLDVTRLEILGGTFGQVLTTDGNGVLSWTTGAGGGGAVRPIIEWTTPANANNQTFTAPNVAAFQNNTYAAVYINGVLQRTNDYIITGNVLTINTYLTTNDVVAIGPTGGGGGALSNVTANTANAISNVIASELGFSLITTPSPLASNGIITLNVPDVAQFRFNANIGNVANANFLVANTVNSNLYLTANGTWSVPASIPAGPNTAVQYNSNGVMAGSNNFTFNGNTVSAVNVFERVTASPGSVIDLATGAYFNSTVTGPISYTVTSVPPAPQVGSFILHITNGGGNVQFDFGVPAGNIKWTGGIVPVISAVGEDVLGFYTLDNGISWYGYVLGQDVA